MIETLQYMTRINKGLASNANEIYNNNESIHIKGMHYIKITNKQ